MPTRAALCSGGSDCRPFPTVVAPMRPSDSRVSFGEQLRSSLAARLPRHGRLFFALRPATRASADGLRVGDSGPAPRVAGSFRGDTWASQVPGSSSSCVPRSYTPPDAASPRLLLLREGRCCLQAIWHPGHPGFRKFRGRCPSARTLACLRIAGRVAASVARLATGWGSFPLRRTGFAPAGRHTEFHEFIA